MRLYCVRHAQAKADMDDACRPLSEGGENEVKRIGTFLSECEVQVQHILHSSRLRAKQTAEGLAPFLHCTQVDECSYGIDTEDPVDDMEVLIDAWEEDTMLVSHLPSIARLVHKLLTGSSEPHFIPFHTCSVVCLEKQDDGQWALDWVVHPTLLARTT